MKWFFISLFILLGLTASLIFSFSRTSQDNTVAQKNSSESFPKISKEETIKIISEDPLWYQNPKIKPMLDKYFREDEEGKSEEFIKEKRAFIQMVGDMLEDGKVKLGQPLENFDEGRLPVDTVVIHHSETAETANLNYINGIHLFTLYIIPAFDNPENSNYGKPVYSGHYDEKGNQVFYGYHYIIRPDGTYKKVLKDEHIGYHARGVNANSVGITIIGSYDKKRPSSSAIKTVKEILETYPGKRVVGHREVTPDTDCPGDTFFGENGWKKELLS